MRKATLLIIFGVVSLSCLMVSPTGTPTLHAYSTTLTNPPVETATPLSTGAATHQPVNTITPERVLHSTATITPTVDLTTNPTIISSPMPLPGYIVPPVVQICPVEREVPLSELGIPPEYRLLVIIPEAEDVHLQNSLMSISSSNPTPMIIQNVSPEGGSYYPYRISPDGDWLVFSSLDEATDQVAYWMGHVDGGSVREIIQMARDVQWNWITDQEAVLIGVPGEAGENTAYFEARRPLFSIDPFMMIIQAFPPLPESGVFDEYLIENGISYAIFYNGENEFENFDLYSYTENTFQPVFQWLVGNERVSPYNYYIHYWNSLAGGVRFLTAAVQPYGLDLAWNLDLNDITLLGSYGEIMQSIIMPGDYTHTSIGALDSTTSLLVIRYSRYIPEVVEHQLYVLDYSDMIIRDYCFDKGNSRVSASRDGRFVAFSFYDDATSATREVIILNLETGYLARIPDIQVIGWGVVEESAP